MLPFTSSPLHQVRHLLILTDVVLNGVPGTPITVTDTPGQEFEPQILINPQGTVYLSWVGNNGDDAPTIVNTVTFASIPNCAGVQH